MKKAAVLLDVRDLGKVFDVSAPWLDRLLGRRPRQYVQAVDGVSFRIERGRSFALVGESGCGKSTVARLLAGLHAPTRGQIRFEGQRLGDPAQRRADPAWRRHLQMIFQDPFASLNPRWRVQDIVAEPLIEHALIAPRDQAALHERVAGLLTSVGLAPADAARFPHQFSGGQRQRIAIARALATQPRLLICDEPTSALDVSVQAQVLNLMKDLQRRQGLAYLFISHNLAVVHHMADEIGVMYLGRLVEVAPKATLFAQPRHPYTRALLDAVPVARRAPGQGAGHRPRQPLQGELPNPLNPPAGCVFHPRCPHANARCRSERPILRLREPGEAGGAATAQVACHGVEEGRV